MKWPFTYRSLLGTAVIAAIYCAIVCTMLIADASGRLAKPPLDEQQYVSLKQHLLTTPGDDAARQSLRELDIQLREQYFRQLQFMKVGVYLLLAGVAVTAIAAHRAAGLRPRLPRPALPAPDSDPEGRIHRLGQAAVVVFVLATVVVIGTITATTPTFLPANPLTSGVPSAAPEPATR